MVMATQPKVSKEQLARREAVFSLYRDLGP